VFEIRMDGENRYTIIYIGEKKGFDRVLPKGRYRSFLSIQFYIIIIILFCVFFFFLSHAVPGTSKGYRTSFIDCNTFILYCVRGFPLRDRNYSFRGWTSGPLFLTVDGLRTPREEPLWPKFREIHILCARNNNTKNNIYLRCVVGSTKAQRPIRTGYPTVFGYAYLLCPLRSLLAIGNVIVYV